ncbi:peptidoglycan-binding protein [Streptomyces afghaniensis]|uniref:peptidoglycan-binding domain-containing protein n=1 Tax=Streptomyces afghaniensis TaxID=66865 RepID=UPI0033B786CC
MPLRPVDPDATTVLPVSPAPQDTTALPVSSATPGPSGPSASPAPQDTTALPVSPATPGPSRPSASPAPPGSAGLPAAPATTPLPTPLAPAPAEPSVTDLRLFDGSGRPDRGRPGSDEPGSRPRRRRRGALLGVAAGACVAVVAAAGYASGLFSYEAPSRDTALPDDLRASVPDAPSSSAASTPPAGSAQATPQAPAAPPPSPSPSATGSPSVSPSPATPSASPSPSKSATPSAPQTSATATGPGNAPPDNSRQNGGPTVLRLGDRGQEVTELQLRLRQLYLYGEDPDGDYDSRLEEAVRNYQWSRGIQTDDLGVYDRETRAKLESETKRP